MHGFWDRWHVYGDDEQYFILSKAMAFSGILLVDGCLMIQSIPEDK
jgi:hypothetical protein